MIMSEKEKSVEDKKRHRELAVPVKPREDGFKEPELEKHGIGIENCLQRKVLFITGATGFFGKVLLEKILRTMPNIGKIYLMIRAKDFEAAKRRLKTEIIDVELFKCIRQTYGKNCEAFMLSKLAPVVGNVGNSNLAIEEHLASEIADDVQIIINSAADTAFSQRYDAALDIHVMGPCNLIHFAKKCRKLELFLHVSTISTKKYTREGRFMEEKLSLGDSMESEASISIPTLLKNEMKLASDYKKIFKDNIAARKLKELGLKRAKEYGWHNTYGFTKAVGEMLIDQLRGEIPIIIFRPSGISCTYKDPFPGWIEGKKLSDPIILYYGKGMLTGFPFNPNGVVNIVPADMVVNAAFAAIAKHLLKAKKFSDINIYHVCSSTTNPLVYEDVFELTYQHFKSSPCIDSNGNPIKISKMNFFNSMPDFSAHLWKDVASNTKLSENLKFKEHAEAIGNIYLPLRFHNYWIDNTKSRGLMKSMSAEEKRRFGFDVTSIDWKDYIINVHIPALRRHILKEKSLCKL